MKFNEWTCDCDFLQTDQFFCRHIYVKAEFEQTFFRSIFPFSKLKFSIGLNRNVLNRNANFFTNFRSHQTIIIQFFDRVKNFNFLETDSYYRKKILISFGHRKIDLKKLLFKFCGNKYKIYTSIYIFLKNRMLQCLRSTNKWKASDCVIFTDHHWKWPPQTFSSLKTSLHS